MNYFQTSDNVKLHYTDHGEGQAIIMISGYGAPASSWIKQETMLLEKGYRVISLDRRSHGFSENSIQGQHLCRHAGDVYELIHELDLKKPILIGQSMGASVIYAFLSIFSDRSLDAAICIDQTPCMLNKDEWDLGMYGFNKENMSVFFDNPIPNGFYRDPEEGYLLPYQDIFEQAGDFDLITTKPLLLDHAYADWRDVFPTVEIPMLFIAGENSPYWSSKHALYCANACKNGSAIIISECGHSVQIERSTECNEAIITFLCRKGEKDEK